MADIENVKKKLHKQISLIQSFTQKGVNWAKTKYTTKQLKIGPTRKKNAFNKHFSLFIPHGIQTRTIFNSLYPKFSSKFTYSPQYLTKNSAHGS